jgi:DNA-binding IclR family transcriptional regulator
MVPALERGLRLLQEFGRDNATLGAPELARRLQLPRATVFRMLNTLESMGFCSAPRAATTTGWACPCCVWASSSCPPWT